MPPLPFTQPMTDSALDAHAFAAALAGQYSLEREIGRGGMGVVYLARDLKLDRLVAIKTLPQHLASDATIRERFLREARTAASLSHPSIVPVHRADELGDFVFFVMGFVEGESLAQRVRTQGPLPASALVNILQDVASALGYAHLRGVVHRDVKAENILLDRHGDRAHVTDFGIARLAQSTPLTQTGTVLGTVLYMSPEQILGESVDGRSDLYSLGVVAFHALSGRYPFESETPSAVLVAHVTRAAPRIREVAPHVPYVLATIVDRLLLKDPSARYDSANSLLDALDHAARTLPPDVRPMTGDELLTPTEAHAVWQRAAVLQDMTGQIVPPPDLALLGADERAPATATSGYRVAQVRDAAAEAGIATRYVERALAEREARSPNGMVQEGELMRPKVNPLFGARTKLEFEAVIDGECSQSVLEELVDEIRRSLGEVGNVSSLGRSVTFSPTLVSSSSGTVRRLQISIAARGGRTTIRAFEDLTPLCGGMFGGITGGVGGGLGGGIFGVVMGATHTVAIALPIWAGVVAGAYGLARTVFAYISRKRENELRTLVDRLASKVREALDNPPLQRPPESRRLGR
jgi:eukaryotic-like serine/threonine-protein kinase